MGMNVPMVSFSGGEIGLEAQARIDLDLYPTTAEVMENVLPTMRGSMIKAPGTEYIGTVDVADTDGAIVRPFIFNVDQTRILEIVENEIRLVDGNAYVELVGGAATVGTPTNNGSTGSATVGVAGTTVTFSTVTGGEARAVYEVTSGALVATTFSFEIQRRPLKISVGTTSSATDILSEITLDPGQHIITILPTATTYYIRVRLEEVGKAKLLAMTRKAAGALVIPTPWAASELRSLRFEQSNDVIWIYHPDYRTRVLERRGDTSWSLRLFRPTTGPFEVMNTSTTTFTPSGVDGSVNVTASKSFFTSDSVGQLIQIEHQGQTERLDATSLDQASDSIRVIGIDSGRAFNVTIFGTFVGAVKLQRSFGNEVDWLDYATYSSATTATINDDLDNQIVYYRLICSAYTSGTIECILNYSGGSTTGRGEIVEYTSATVAVVEVYETFGSNTSSARWNVGSWNEVDGYPAAGQISESRHWLVRDDRVWASVADDYENMLIGSEAADAIARTIGTGDVNAAQWIEMGTRVVIGTSGSEVEVLSNEYNERITFLNMNARPIGDDGSADAQAVRAGKRIIFIDRTRARLLQAYFDADTATTDTDNLVRLHEKIAGEIEQDSGDGFVELAYQRMPEPRLWAVRSDGQLAVMLYAPKEGIYAWGRIRAANDGIFKSVCVIPGTPEDRVHVLVEREIDGETVLYHERFALNKFPLVADADGNFSAPKAWRLQCASVTSGAAATVFSGLEHLEGETVSVWADGRDGGEYTVSSGLITLDTAAEYVIIGLKYRGKWKSSKLAFGARNGTALTQDKSVGRLGVCIHETPIGVLKYGRSFDAIDANGGDELEIEFSDGIIMDAPVILKTQDNNLPFEGVTEIDPRVCLVMDGPAPVTVLALVPNVDLEEAA